MTKNELTELTYKILGCAIKIHKELGPGLLEGIYEKCLLHLLKQENIAVYSQRKVPVVFEGLYLDCDLRYDLLVEDQIIVEVKAVETLLPIHEAQILTYLKLLDKPKGILINFNCTNIFKYGQKTFVTKKYQSLPD
jgi:GxxExxY protein